MSSEPQDVMALLVMVLGIVSILGSIFLSIRRKLPEGSLSRTTLLVVGLALTQVGSIAADQDERGDLIRIGLLALLLIVLAAVAFRDGWRRSPAGPPR